MDERRKLQVRRTAIVVFILGTFIAAVVGVLAFSRGLADDQARPGETCIYLASGRQLCGPRAVEFCDETESRRSAEDVAGRETCERVRREQRAG